jgi:hypothetical protein
MGKPKHQDTLYQIGGGRIGRYNATFPFASLRCDPYELKIRIGFERLTFTPEDVIAIKSYIRIPLIGWGIQVVHNLPQYPAFVVFWCFGFPATLIEEIYATGFSPQAGKIKNDLYQDFD